VVRSAALLEDASNDAVTSCNSQFGGCALSQAAVASTSYGCLVLANSTQDAGQLYAATSSSLDGARNAVTQQLNSAGVSGQVQYAGCNG
jgi:hypothetical protein